eukprot:CAMPEP_0177649426 /NCGR_PEP_ID=MMETSP0447-20121125/11379_1 /TAXON_ID=0 /ORGANISM="Stygamoeba regulata, Strain BSH-02190019" /LENGTH=288 /DNA_ID=CAMNT_0019152181 /DNA_START=231 /DNA_END=1097 /DNA_ORIENTATION=-
MASHDEEGADSVPQTASELQPQQTENPSGKSAVATALTTLPESTAQDVAQMCPHLTNETLERLHSGDLSAEEKDAIWKEHLLELLNEDSHEEMHAATPDGKWKEAYARFSETLQIKFTFIRPSLFKLFLRVPSNIDECLSLNLHIDVRAVASLCHAMRLYCEGEETMAKLGSCDLIFANFPQEQRPTAKIDTDIYVRFCGEMLGMGGSPMHVTDQDVEELLDAVRYEHEKLSPRSQTTHRVCGFALLGLCNKRMLMIKFYNALQELVSHQAELEREDFVEQIGADWLI